MKNKARNKKILAALLGTGIPAAALAISVPFWYSNTDRIKYTMNSNAHKQLEELIKRSEEFLSTNDATKSGYEEELKHNIRLAKQILSQELSNWHKDIRSLVLSLLQHRNKMQLSLAKAQSKINHINNQSQAGEQMFASFSHLLSAHDLKAKVNSELKDYNNKHNFEQTFAQMVSLAQKNANLILDLETKANVFELNLQTRQDNLNIRPYVNIANGIVEWVRNQIRRGISSRDEAVVLSDLLEQKLNDLFKVETEHNDAIIKPIYAKIADAKANITSQQLDESIKDKLHSELDAIEFFIQANKGLLQASLDLDKNQSLASVIDEYLSAFWTRNAQYFNNVEQTKAYLSSQLDQAKNLAKTIPTQFKATLDLLIAKANKYIKDADFQNITDFNAAFMRDFNAIKIAHNLLDKSLTKLQNAQLDKQNIQLLTTKAQQVPYKDFFEYIKAIDKIVIQASVDEQIKQFYNEQSIILKSQVKDADINSSKYAPTSSAEFNTLVQSLPNKSIDTTLTPDNIANEFAINVNTLRKQQKIILSHLINAIDAEFAKESIQKSPDLVAQWQYLRPIFNSYANEFSTATRQELSSLKPSNELGQENAIYQAINILEKAKIAVLVNAIESEAQNIETIINKTYQDSANSEAKQNLINQVRSFATQAKLIQANANLSVDQKQAQLAQIAAWQTIFKSKIDVAKELADTAEEAQRVLKAYENDDIARTYFSKEMKSIIDLVEQAQQALKDPANESFNLTKINRDLKFAVDDFGNKIARAGGDSTSKAIKKQIKDTFINKRHNSQPSIIEQKLNQAIDKLAEESKSNRDNTNKNELEKQAENEKIKNKMRILQLSLQSLSDLDSESKNLESDLVNSKAHLDKLEKDSAQNSQNQTLTQQIEEIKKVNAGGQSQLDEVRKLIESELFNPNIHNKEFFDAKTFDLAKTRKNIAISSAQGDLENESINLAKHKISNSDLKNQAQVDINPYSQLNSDIDLLINEKKVVDKFVADTKNEIATLDSDIQAKSKELQQLWNQKAEISNPDALSANTKAISQLEGEIASLRSELKTKQEQAKNRAQNMADKINARQQLLARLKEAAIKLSEIDKTKYPELVATFEKDINANHSLISDSAGETNNKLFNLNQAIDKIEISKATKDKLDELKQLKQNQFKDNNDSSQRDIFKDVDNEIEQKISKYTEILFKPETTKVQLENLMSDITQDISSFRAQKQAINNRLENSVKDVEKLIKDYLDKEKQENIKGADNTEETEIKKLDAEFKELISKAKNNSETQSKYDILSHDKLDEVKNRLYLAYQKDKFFTNKHKLDEKIKNLESKLASKSLLNGTNAQNKKVVEQLKDVVKAMDDFVKAQMDPNQASEVIKQLNRIVALEDLIEVQNKVADTVENSDDKYKQLSDVFKNINLSINANGAEHPSVIEINSERDKLQDALDELLTLDKIKEDVTKFVDSVKTEYDSKVKNQATDFQAGANKVDEELDKLKQEIQAITQSNDVSSDKKKVREIEQEARNIKNNIQNTADFAKFLKDAKAEKDKSVGGALKTQIETVKNELSTKINEASTDFTKFEEQNKHTKEIQKILDKLKHFEKSNTAFSELKAKIDTLQSQGSNGTTSQNPSAKLNEFYDKLVGYTTSMASSNYVKDIQLLNGVIEQTKSLVDLQKNTLDTETKIPEFKFNNIKYGYDSDIENIRKTVLESVPSAESDTFSATDLKNKIDELSASLPVKIQKAKDLQQARKRAFEQIQQAFTEDQAKVTEPKYAELKKDMETWFKETLDKISKITDVNQINEIDKAMNDFSSTRSLLDLYKQIADNAEEAKEKQEQANKLTEKSDSLTETIQSLTTQLEAINKPNSQTVKDNYYYNEKSPFVLSAKIKELKTTKTKIDLFTLESQKEQELKESQLSEDAKKLVHSALDNFVNKVKQDRVLNDSKLKELQNEYLNDGALGFETLFESSKELSEAITKAEKFVVPGDQKDYVEKQETPEMQKLYKDLEHDIATAKDLLTNYDHSKDYQIETKRDEIVERLLNNSYGLVTKLKLQKSNEINKLKHEINDVKQLIKDNFGSSATGFENIDLNSPDFKTIQSQTDLKTQNDKYIEASNKLKELKKQVVERSKNQVKNMVNVLKQYVDFLKGSTQNTNGGISTEEATLLRGYLWLDKYMSEYEKHILEAQSQQNNEYDEAKYESQAFELLKHFKILYEDYTHLNSISKASYSSVKEQLNEFKKELESPNNDSLYKQVASIQNKNQYKSAEEVDGELKTKIDTAKTSISDLGSNEGSFEVVKTSDNLRNGDISAISQYTAQFNKYKDGIAKLSKAIKYTDTLIYGSSSSDENGLEGLYNKVLENMDFSNMLKLIAGSEYQKNDLISNEPFKPIITAYKAQFDTIKESNKKSADEVLKKKENSFLSKLEALKSIYTPISKLIEWLNLEENKQLFFSSLAENDSKVIKHIKPLSSTLLETFEEKVKLLGNSSGNNEIEITNQTELLNLFEHFNILKGDKQYFNTSNVKVYLTKETSNPNYSDQIYLADTTYKKAKINLSIRYQKPSNGNNFFNYVEGFRRDFKDIWVNFETLKSFSIKKDNMLNDRMREQTPIFEWSKAGWNIKNPYTELLNLYAKNASYMKKHNLKFIREDVSFHDEESWNKAMQNKLAKTSNIQNKIPEFNMKLYNAIDPRGSIDVDWSTSSSFLKYKIRLVNDGIVQNGDGKRWKMPKVNGKSFMYWTQNGNDFEISDDSKKYDVYTPWFVFIPLVHNDSFCVLHISYENKWSNSSSGFNSTFFENINDYTNAKFKWHFYWWDTPNSKEIARKTNDRMSKEFKNISDNNIKTAIKANIFAEEFAKAWSDKGELASENYGGWFHRHNRWTNDTLSGSNFITFVDKYENT
ncbi:hypothetical protein MCFN_01435 [Mycoplasmopsis californica]|uniref:Uncharacterized protein n=1 Tax=Mycoplasmopsis californica TaxID=2113 RepID=A0A059XVS3_9BACT|nr:hypothetical protein [Mycoplasmopsis californica]AIA29431.1 hypothetical protein MCFN_01435 [Mycoplasmopsis californica]